MKIRSALAQIQNKGCNPSLKKFTSQDLLYKNYNYNASFSKTLQHDETTGALVATDQYENLACSMFASDLSLLASVKQATGAEFGLVNPSAAFSAVLEGAPQCTLSMPTPPAMSSAAAAAEMVEVYAQAFARDVSFIDYSTDATITSLLGVTRMNEPAVIANLLYAPTTPFTAQSLFRGNADGVEIGPYISQLFLLPVPTSATTTFEQQYTTYLPRAGPFPPGTAVEWGTTAADMISIQNASLSVLTPALDTPKYIYNGRTLAEAVHNDAVYQYYYQATLILSNLGAPLNADFPSFSNQDAFITDNGIVNVLTALAGAAKLAFKHAWYWKWVKFRRLRPEVYSLWVDNVLNAVVPNAGNYNLNDIVLTNDITTIDIPSLYGSYTLPLCFQEGSPSHPSAPAGHAILSGCVGTVAKMFFENDTDWTTLNPVMETNSAGNALVAFGGSTAGMTVATEINKLVFNVVLGRNYAGVHYRSDGFIELGENLAMKYMADILSAAKSADVTIMNKDRKTLAEITGTEKNQGIAAKVEGIKSNTIEEFLIKTKDKETVAVVADAKKKSSPLHSIFEWDDKTAAHKFRLVTARKLISAVYVVCGDGEREPAFVSVKTPYKQYYQSAEIACEHIDEWTSVVESARQAIEQAYDKLLELKAVSDRVMPQHTQKIIAAQKALLKGADLVASTHH